MSKLELKIPPVIVVLIFGFLMWGVSLWLPRVNGFSDYRLVGCLITFVVGVFFGVLGIWSFRRAKTTVNPTTPKKSTSLVTIGIYKRTRNPMYVGMLSFLIGWGVYLSNPFSLLCVFLFVLYMNKFQIKPEEKALRSIFGSDFFNLQK